MAKRTEKPAADLDFLEKIKTRVVISMFSDDVLMDRLVLKGGNALDLVLRISSRASVDVDLSMKDDFPAAQLGEIRARIETSLKESFRDLDLIPFDVQIVEKPENISPDLSQFWGGYEVQFKLIGRAKSEKFTGDLASLRRNAIQIGPRAKFLVDISRFEFTDGKAIEFLDDYQISVYSPEMLVCEKLRAICQQMPEYGPVVRRNRAGAPRARDFLDINTILCQRDIDLKSKSNFTLLTNIFKAKRVPLNLLGLIRNYREFHRADWPAVEASVKPGVKIRDFDFYFDFVLELVELLKPLWNK